MQPEISEIPALYELKARPKHFIVMIVSFIFTILILIALFAFLFITRPPHEFPQNSSITIKPGTSVAAIVNLFQKERYVKSSSVLLAYLRFFYHEENIKAGTYLFSDPVSVGEVANQIVTVGPEDPLVSITIPEGSSVKQIAATAKERLPNFDYESFLTYASPHEGYLLPETYFVPDTFSDKQLFELLRETYDEKINPLREQIDAHPLSEAEILTLASIIEREANSTESMRLVSAVLQNRMSIEMPLQADATIEYILDTPLNKLPPGQLAQELRETDSPYNTYLYTGLPPTPIGNPGIEAITAVLSPAPSDYFYYLTDEQGDFHYARTLAEHNHNIAQYLR